MSWADHLQRQILPWWEAQADDDDGGVFTAVDDDARRRTTQKFTWSQGRWGWVSAELAAEIDAGRLDGDADRWRQRARRTAALLDRARRPGGRVAFVTDRFGVPVPGADDSVYADLFAVLGWAGALGLEADETRQRAAEDVLLAAERSIAARTAPTAPYPVPPGFTELAGPMCLLHAGAELHRHTGSRPAAAVRDRALAHLLGDGGLLQASTWWEFRPDDPTLTDSLLARHRTPGHLLECLWMILHAAPERADTARLGGLAHAALALGRDDEHGGLLRYTDVEGGEPRGRRLPGDPPYQALVERTWSTKLWWVHVEAVYGLTLLDRRCPDPALAAAAAELADYTLRVFPRPGGEWVQIRDRAGDPLDEVVALPVKDPFHTIRALLLLNRLDHTNAKETGA